MDINLAIRAHTDWKARFSSALSQKEQLDAACVAADDCCALGKWLHGDGKSSIGATKRYQECVKRHAEFHKEAGKVATAINQKRYTDAMGMMDDGTPFATTSAAVVETMLALKSEMKP